jgi:aminopeptidase C
MVMNDPRRDYYKTYEVEYDRHTYDGHNWKYVNLPMDDIEQMAITAILYSLMMNVVLLIYVYFCQKSSQSSNSL